MLIDQKGLVRLQTTKELQRNFASKSCELSAALLDLHCWKRKTALQQLRLISAQEDIEHHKVHAQALTDECSRRQVECSSLQAQLQTVSLENTQLEAKLADNAATAADMQVSTTDGLLTAVLCDVLCDRQL